MSYKNNQEKSKGMTRRVKDMAIIVVDNNNTNEGNKMSKFNENVQVEETNEYQIGELMNELNQEKEVKMSFPMKVAMEIYSGKTEKEVIGLIGQVLTNLGENPQAVNYLLNVDEDFISDVLGCYNSLKFGICFDGFPCKALRFETKEEAVEYRKNNITELMKSCEYQVGVHALPNKMRG